VGVNLRGNVGVEFVQAMRTDAVGDPLPGNWVVLTPFVFFRSLAATIAAHARQSGRGEKRLAQNSFHCCAVSFPITNPGFRLERENATLT
jgi:hypothetical protein